VSSKPPRHTTAPAAASTKTRTSRISAIRPPSRSPCRLLWNLRRFGKRGKCGKCDGRNGGELASRSNVDGREQGVDRGIAELVAPLTPNPAPLVSPPPVSAPRSAAAAQARAIPRSTPCSRPSTLLLLRQLAPVAPVAFAAFPAFPESPEIPQRRHGDREAVESR